MRGGEEKGDRNAVISRYNAVRSSGRAIRGAQGADVKRVHDTPKSLRARGGVEHLVNRRNVVGAALEEELGARAGCDGAAHVCCQERQADLVCS